MASDTHLGGYIYVQRPGGVFLCGLFAGKMSNVLMSVRFASIMRWVSICVFGGLALLLFVEMFAG